MTGDDFQIVLSAPIAWCRKEHAAALRQVELFATDGPAAQLAPQFLTWLAERPRRTPSHL